MPAWPAAIAPRGGSSRLLGALVGMIFMLLTGLGVLGTVDWPSLLMRFGICVILGTLLSVIAAVPPALRAARMQAADAMRTEI